MKDEHQKTQDRHDYDFRLMLLDIERRVKNAEIFGDGQKDIVVSLFRHRLDKDCLHRCKSAAPEVYRLRLAHLSSAETAAILGISEENVRELERYLLALYGRACLRAGRRRPRFEGEDLLYRRDVTGAVDYQMCSHDGLIGRAHCAVIPGFPIVLQRNALVLNCNFPPEQTIIPGISRIISDADNGREFARLTYLGADTHMLRLNWDEDKRMFLIRKSSTGTYWVLQDDELYAQLFQPKAAPCLHEWSQRYKLHIYQPVSEDLAFLFLSFPLLRFI